MTRADQWAAFAHAVLAVAIIAIITSAGMIEALRIGAAAAGLLYLLPVLWVSGRAGLSAGLTSAAFAAFCYNFFLLEPRYTLQIHGVGDVAAFVVMMVTALVTSSLASGLRAREIEAKGRAEASAMEAEFTALLAQPRTLEALDAAALSFLTNGIGEALLVRGDDLSAKRTGLSPLDATAAAWALHNGGMSGHGTEVMAAADFRFVPLARDGDDVLALAPGGHASSYVYEAAPSLARAWTQARDRLTTEAERKARGEAEQREAVRRTLLAALGHDFRTPLTLLKAGLAEIDGEAASRLSREVDRIARLGEDLLAAARIEEGHPARMEPVDLVDIYAAAVSSTALSPDVVVQVDMPEDLPLVWGDAVMLVHLLGNVLDNAVRHARTGVLIQARCLDNGVEVNVLDDGDGIDPAVANALFDRFVSGSDREGGSGLGLAIARDLATAMGATLTAENAPEGGACFRLTLTPFTLTERAV